MNLILIVPDEVDDQGNVVLLGRRAEHIVKIIQPQIQDQLKLGVKFDDIFLAMVVSVQSNPVFEVKLKVNLSTPIKKPPPPLELILVLALPRPKVAKRLVQLCAEFGIKELHFIHAYRVEKSYWQSPLLSKEVIDKQIQLGLEQSVDTVPMRVELHNRFKPFVQDKLALLSKNSPCYLAHPPRVIESQEVGGATSIGDAPSMSNQLVKLRLAVKNKRKPIVVIGPEGGFIDYEIALLQDNGGQLISLGERIYRTETVVPLVLGMLCTS